MSGFFPRLRRRVRVEIICGCGDVFVPATYTPRKGNARRYGCSRCGLKVRLSMTVGAS